MGDITMAQIAEAITLLAAIAGGLGVLYKKLKKWLGKLFEDQLLKIEAKQEEQIRKIEVEMQSLRSRMDVSDMENVKNFLVRCLADVERGGPMSDTEEQRFWEQYEHYRQVGGNSYIRQKVEKLQAAGKL